MTAVSAKRCSARFSARCGTGGNFPSARPARAVASSSAPSVPDFCAQPGCLGKARGTVRKTSGSLAAFVVSAVYKKGISGQKEETGSDPRLLLLFRIFVLNRAAYRNLQRLICTDGPYHGAVKPGPKRHEDAWACAGGISGCRREEEAGSGFCAGGGRTSFPSDSSSCGS